MTEIASFPQVDLEARPSDPSETTRYPGQLANILVDSLEILEKARQALLDSLEILKNVLQALAGNRSSNGPATAVQHTDPTVVPLPRRERRTAPALTLIQKHYATDPAKPPPTKLPVGTAATACGMRSREFSKVFKEEHDEPYKTYVLNYRLRRSCELLKQGTSVKNAALSLGFTDLSYFSREFRGRFKLTPTRFKEMHMMGAHQACEKNADGYPGAARLYPINKQESHNER